MPDIATTPPAKKRGCLRRLLPGALAALLLLAGALWIWHRPVLQSLARNWVVDEPPVSATAIVVLGGSPERRPQAAARLFREGYAPKILVPRVKAGPGELKGLRKNDADLAKELLLQEGVPDSAVELIGKDVASTFDETQAVKEWLATQGGGGAGRTSLIIPTETFFTRRTRWIFERTLGGRAKTVIVAIPTEMYTVEDWWQHEQGLIDFQNEIIKALYYRWKY